MAVVYVGFSVAWMSEMARLREHVVRIHYLCLSCILVKLIEVVLWAAYYDRQVRRRWIKSALLGLCNRRFPLSPPHNLFCKNWKPLFAVDPWGTSGKKSLDFAAPREYRPDRTRPLVFLLPRMRRPPAGPPACVPSCLPEQNKEGQGQDLLNVAVRFFQKIFLLVFLLTLLLFSLGWGFVRPALRSKEGWLVTSSVAIYCPPPKKIYQERACLRRPSVFLFSISSVICRAA